MIQTLRKFRGARPSKFGGGQSRDIFRGGPVKKITLYVIPVKFTIRQKRFVIVPTATKKSGVATGIISYCDSKSKFTELTIMLEL